MRRSATSFKLPASSRETSNLGQAEFVPMWLRTLTRKAGHGERSPLTGAWGMSPGLPLRKGAEQDRADRPKACPEQRRRNAQPRQDERG